VRVCSRPTVGLASSSALWASDSDLTEDILYKLHAVVSYFKGLSKMVRGTEKRVLGPISVLGLQ
jgi:hypothetical protein